MVFLLPCGSWTRMMRVIRGRPLEGSIMAKEKERTYSEAEISTKIQQLGLAGWYLEDGWLRRKYNTDGWPQTLMAVNAIGYLCEAAYHHADLAVTYAKLWVKLQTHSAGGITDKDFEMARKIEDLVLWRPNGGVLGTGNPEKFVFAKGSPGLS